MIVYPKEKLEECEVGDFAWYSIDNPEKWAPTKRFFIILEKDQPNMSDCLDKPFTPAPTAPEIVVREFEAVQLGVPRYFRSGTDLPEHRVRAWRRIK